MIKWNITSLEYRKGNVSAQVKYVGPNQYNWYVSHDDTHFTGQTSTGDEAKEKCEEYVAEILKVKKKNKTYALWIAADERFTHFFTDTDLQALKKRVSSFYKTGGLWYLQRDSFSAISESGMKITIQKVYIKL